MASNPPGPPPAGGLREDPSEPDDGRSHSERYGSVTVARHRKDDGRALILYTHDEQEPSE